jgi:hypothetical protein
MSPKSDPLADPRVDELLALGNRIARISSLFKKVRHADHHDKQALYLVQQALRQRFWQLAHTIASELPQ